MSARSRAIVRRISSACAAVSSATAAWICGPAAATSASVAAALVARAPEREPEDDRRHDCGGEARGEDPDDHAGNAIGGERDERGRDEDGRGREQPQRRLGRGDERLAGERLAPAVGQLQLARHRDDLAARAPHRRREAALREREDGRPRRGEQRAAPDRPGSTPRRR